MDPPSGQSYLRLNGVLGELNATTPAPFPLESQFSHYTGSGTFPADDADAIEQATSLSDWRSPLHWTRRSTGPARC